MTWSYLVTMFFSYFFINILAHVNNSTISSSRRDSNWMYRHLLKYSYPRSIRGERAAIDNVAVCGTRRRPAATRVAAHARLRRGSATSRAPLLPLVGNVSPNGRATGMSEASSACRFSFAWRKLAGNVFERALSGRPDVMPRRGTFDSVMWAPSAIETTASAHHGGSDVQPERGQRRSRDVPNRFPWAGATWLVQICRARRDSHVRKSVGCVYLRAWWCQL